MAKNRIPLGRALGRALGPVPDMYNFGGFSPISFTYVGHPIYRHNKNETPVLESSIPVLGVKLK